MGYEAMRFLRYEFFRYEYYLEITWHANSLLYDLTQHLTPHTSQPQILNQRCAGGFISLKALLNPSNMEVLSVLLFIVVIILILSLKNNLYSRFDKLDAALLKLKDQMLKSTIERTGAKIEPPVTVTSPEQQVSIPYIQKFKQREPEPEVKIEKSLSEALQSILQDTENTVDSSIPSREIVAETIEPAPALEDQPLNISSPQPIIPRKPTFMERNPDMEKFIGENLVSKIGIVILVLAIGYFVKFAIDNDWIGPVGRVGIGITCGAILVGVAHVLRNSYKAFSSVLAGGGLAVFYFTITLGFHQFHLFSQTVAFVIMVVITCFAVILSQLYNRQEVAIIALIGGFATPFMVSTGSGNYKILFSYLLILNAGLLVLAYKKAWRLLNLLAFIFTFILFGSWLFTLENNTATSTYFNGLLFATSFYLMFFIINIAYNIRGNKKFIASDFGILLANTSLYFAAGLYLLTMMKAGPYRGLFTAAISIFNLGASYILFRNRKIDNNILYLLIGITLSFISLTAPIQLNGNNITLFWASEAVLLYWLFQKSKIRIIKYGSLIVWVAMLVSLMMDWTNVYGFRSTIVPVVINKGFITTFFSAVATYLLFRLRKKDIRSEPGAGNVYLPDNIFRITAIMLLFAAGAFEINYQFNHHYPDLNLSLIYLLLYTLFFIYLFILITEKLPSLQLNFYIKTSLLALCVVLYLFSIGQIFDIQKNMLEQNYLINHFIAHWFAALLIIFILYKIIVLIRSKLIEVQKSLKVLTWIICFIVVILLSAEIHLMMNYFFYNKINLLSNIQRVYIKTGLPILWGLCSFGFMWLGMRHKYRSLRIISLTLFSITLLKLFIFDIRNIPVAGKIAAFFSLGILLLVISFMYQRLKKIIIEDEKKPVL